LYGANSFASRVSNFHQFRMNEKFLAANGLFFQHAKLHQRFQVAGGGLAYGDFYSISGAG
jgi:hypothetical protein